MKEYEITHASGVPVTVVRVTPLGEDGTPDHPWALTYHYDAPVMLCAGTYEPLHTWPGEVLQRFSHRMVGALVAAYEHEQRRDVQALKQGIWQRRRTGAAVEGWAEEEPGRWWYVLVPWWRHRTDREAWPLKSMGVDDDTHRVYALGDLRPVDRYAWPALSPLDEPHDVSRGTQLVMAHTHVAPPPIGFPAFTG
ncbi:hypothetical protein SUDANB1_05612 [Streptomyces sp. enrichment culture]|uniref:hypothetical protein n=1 Tax=Streptomyces sp. enrichment culture TaxID=1795815 RepID=UPI003F5583A7